MDTARTSVTTSTLPDVDRRTVDHQAADHRTGGHLAVNHRAVDHRTVDHLRTRSAERGPCVRLHDAAVAFDDLLGTARRHGLVERSEIRRSLGAVVHAISSSITPRDVGGDPRHPSEPIGSVLLDRAAARFSTRVVGTEIGRRPCPPSVLTALHAARHSLEAAGALSPAPAGPARPSDRDVDVSTVVDVVVLGLLRDRARIEPVLHALAPLRPSPVRLVGTPVPRPSPGARELLDLEWGPSRSSSPTTRRNTPDVRLAGVHLTWIAQMLGEAGHHVVSTDIYATPLSDLTGRDTVAVVVSAGFIGSVRAAFLRRRIRRAGGTVVNSHRNRRFMLHGAAPVEE